MNINIKKIERVDDAVLKIDGRNENVFTCELDEFDAEECSRHIRRLNDEFSRVIDELKLDLTLDDGSVMKGVVPFALMMNADGSYTGYFRYDYRKFRTL